MGHQISAYKISDKKKEVASIGRSGFSPHGIEMYLALNCIEFYAGSNGIGAEREFTKEQPYAAMDYFEDVEELDYERAFISACLDNIGEMRLY
ncbi:MAG: hypothetical protein IT261_13250 [Saprospiraceae bacterium]|nr:hypothetical protein [Saprospiraceae bacterium]